VKVSGVLLTILISVCVNFSNAQTLDETYAFAEKLMARGDYDLAIKNFKRVLFFDSTYKFPEATWLIADCNFASGNYSDALYFYQLAFNETDNDSIKAAGTIMKAASNMKLENYSEALIDIYSFQGNTTPRQLFNLRMLEGIITYNMGDYSQAEQNFKEAAQLTNTLSVDEISAFFASVRKIEKRYNPKVARTMSIIIPGSGQFYSGNYRSGINSFVLTVGLMTFGVYLTQGITPIDAFFIIAPWFQRYYMGGYKNAYNQALDKQKELKTEKLRDIVNRLSKPN
jgi:tetratricopeptide (TPR) repeat protein